MNQADKEFKNLIEVILKTGEIIYTRNSEVTRLTTPTPIVFTETPLVSWRRTAWKNALREWEWFMSGSCDINDLDSRVHSWWRPWANAFEELPNNYSMQFRKFHGRHYSSGGLDQVNYIVDGIKNHPNSRRLVITTWNTADMVHSITPITNCHGTVIQFFVNKNNSLDMFMYQRSCDVMLGLQHNWIQYWAFLLWICNKTGKTPGKFTWLGGDVHIYKSHMDTANEIIDAEVLPTTAAALEYIPRSEEFKADDFEINGEYSPVLTKKLKMEV